MDMRKGDEIKYIHPQEENADVIVTFTEKDKSVDLEYECKSEYGCEVMVNLKNFTIFIETFYSVVENHLLSMNLYKVLVEIYLTNLKIK